MPTEKLKIVEGQMPKPKLTFNCPMKGSKEWDELHGKSKPKLTMKGIEDRIDENLQTKYTSHSKEEIKIIIREGFKQVLEQIKQKHITTIENDEFNYGWNCGWNNALEIFNQNIKEFLGEK